MATVFETLMTQIGATAQRYSTLDSYYSGTQPLAFLSPEARAALGTRFGVMCTNIPRLAVGALTERLRVTGFTVGGVVSPELWSDWLANDLDQLAPVAHREAFTLGDSYVIVWGGPTHPLVSIESARQMSVIRDPGTREILAAGKRWDTTSTTEAVVYEGQTITRYRADQPGATTTGFRVVETIVNPFGVPPVVAMQNADRLLGAGMSEIDDLMPLVDGLNKTLSDMLVSSEYAGRPRRWASGIELVEEDVVDETGAPTGETRFVNPFPEGTRMMTSEDPASRFGALPAADLGGYESAVRVLLGQISAVSGLPSHYLGTIGDQPPSADSLRAAEASLTARAEARQATFGRAWERVGALMVAARTGVDPRSVKTSVKWADAGTRSIAQEADATVKLYAAGLLPYSYALARLGYSDDEIATIRTARRAEALDAVGTDLTALIP